MDQQTFAFIIAKNATINGMWS